MKGFAIENRLGEAFKIPINELDKEAAEFWGVELDKKRYASPNKGSMNWFDFIGYNITQMETINYPCNWDNLKVQLWCSVISGCKEFLNSSSLGDKLESVVFNTEYLEPYMRLIDHWKSKDYYPVIVE